MSEMPSKWSFIASGAVAAVAVAALAGCGSASVAQPTAAEASTASARAVATTEPSAAATTTAVAATAAATTTAVAPVAPVSAAAAPAVAAVMPSVVCMNLQAAQDTIQDAGVFFSRSKDATGADRRQVVDANWIVVGQTPAAGETVGEAEAVLSAVKIGEPSPC